MTVSSIIFLVAGNDLSRFATRSSHYGRPTRHEVLTYGPTQQTLPGLRNKELVIEGSYEIAEKEGTPGRILEPLVGSAVELAFQANGDEDKAESSTMLLSHYVETGSLFGFVQWSASFKPISS